MEHQRWIKRSLISAAVAASIGLTACGGGGGTDTITQSDPTNATTTLSGIVADGYLLNATVCLDLNLSKTCDSGEPTATSTSGGNYSLEATQAQIDTYPVIAEIIAGTTVDEDNPSAPVAKAYTLSAPAGKGAFVSPLSTMVQAQIETTGKTADQIENEILASIGQDPTIVSLFDDYVASKTDTANSAAVQESYLQLHQIAQVTASTIANNIELIEAAVTSGEITMDLSTTLDSLITIIVQNVIEELTTISTEIDNATSFDANAIASSAVPPVDTATIEDQVAVAEAAANAAVATNLEAIFTSGINWLWAEFSDWDSDELERSSISYDATTGKIAEPIESYFATSTPGWSLLPSETDNLVLQADGTWKPVVDSWDGSAASFDNTAGTANIDSPWGMEQISNFKASDLTGLNIKQFVANKLPDLATFIDPESTFTTGSEAYSLNLISLEDSYSIWVWGGCGGGVQYVNGNCNTVIDYSTPQNSSPYNSLISLPVTTAFDPSNSSNNMHLHDLGSVDGNISPYQSMYFELVKGASNESGTTNYYLLTFGDSVAYTKVGTGAWSIITVNGTELLMVDHPDTLISQYLHVTSFLDSPQENSFFAMQDSVVRQGSHWPANIVENTAESLLTNQQAQMEITGAFLDDSVINATPSGDLACDTTSDWNELFNGPWTLYSFADYEAVVIACGGVVNVDDNTLLGGNISQFYTAINGAMFQFDQGNTGFYMAPTTGNNTPQAPIPINWTIDPVTNYITVDDPAGSFRFTLAVIAIDSTVSPSLFTIKQYIEEAGSSDMSRDQGSDGQIVDLTFQ